MNPQRHNWAEVVVHGLGHTAFVLAVEGLGKRYGGRWLFRNLAFELAQGDCLVILGRNGSGKSTLVKALAGLVRPSEGKVSYPDGDLRSVLSMSALEMSLYPTLTVEEHLELGGDLRGCDSRREELLEMIGLTGSRGLLASQISTGMKARVKMALAIQANPSVLLLDEPGAGLDEAGRGLVEAICAEQKKRGCLVLATNEASERRFATMELELES